METWINAHNNKELNTGTYEYERAMAQIYTDEKRVQDLTSVNCGDKVKITGGSYGTSRENDRRLHDGNRNDTEGS